MPTLTSSHLDETNDTEITLGTGKMLAIFFGLVILCAIFFGMGFSMGRNSVKSAPELLPSPSTATGSRPSANAKPTQTPAPDSKSAGQAQTNQDSNSPNPAASTPDQTTPQPPSPIGPGYFVQVAAVSKQEDAEALVEALKGRQYSAFIATPSPDKFFHVQIGPFDNIKEAESTRAKLVSDGYNPILKK